MNTIIDRLRNAIDELPASPADDDRILAEAGIDPAAELARIESLFGECECEETECPASSDQAHCHCWYDGDSCCRCGDSACPASTGGGHCLSRAGKDEAP